MSYLVDTNVISELRKRVPNPNVIRWFEQTDPDTLFLSVLVVGELRHGVELLRTRDPDRSAGLDAWVGTVREQFGDRILPVTSIVAEAWGRLRAIAPLPVIDSLVTATALVNGLVLVTRDVSTPERVGVPWLDPWRA